MRYLDLGLTIWKVVAPSIGLCSLSVHTSASKYLRIYFNAQKLLLRFTCFVYTGSRPIPIDWDRDPNLDSIIYKDSSPL